MSKPIDYDFHEINPTMYELDFILPFKNRQIMTIFNKSKKKLSKKGVAIPDDSGELNEFEADARYLKLIHTIIRKLLKQVEREVKADGIHVVTSEVVRCVYRRIDQHSWKAHIYVKGDYFDKR